MCYELLGETTRVSIAECIYVTISKVVLVVMRLRTGTAMQRYPNSFLDGNEMKNELHIKHRICLRLLCFNSFSQLKKHPKPDGIWLASKKKKKLNVLAAEKRSKANALVYDIPIKPCIAFPPRRVVASVVFQTCSPLSSFSSV